MATFGTFADLTPAQVELAQRRQATGGDPLSNLLQGLQQGVQLQQLPQQLANQAIAQQVAAQLQQVKLLTAQKQLEELNKTPAQRAREAMTLQAIQRGLATESLREGPAGLGTVALPGATGFTVDELAALQQTSQAPQMPGAIPNVELPTSDLSFQQQAAPGLQLQVPELPALDLAIGQALQRQNPSFQIPTAPSRGVETEIPGMAGFYRSSALEQDFRQREIDRQNEIEMNKIRSEAPGTFIGSVRQGQRGEGFIVPERGGKNILVSPGQSVLDQSGKVIYQAPKDQKNSRPLNVAPGAKVIDAEGNIIFENTSSASGGGSGLKPPATAQADYLGHIEINRELNQTKNFADEIQKTGKFPSSGQVALNQFLAARPEDVPGAGLIPGIDTVYAAFQNQLGKAQTPESRELEARRAYIASTLIRIQAGLAQTNAEFRNIGPTTPKSSDTYEQLVAKLDILTKRNLDKISDYQSFYPEFRGMTFRGLGDAPAPVQDVIERQPGESTADFLKRKHGF